MQQSEDNLYDLFSFVELTDIHSKLKTQENRLLQAEEETKSKTSFSYFRIIWAVILTALLICGCLWCLFWIGIR